ncbi:MAG: hypothetical protein M3198_13700 [Actinomycetota bacterium]|nr:hypothetical protein [Actinomycetota bacterium]
MDPDQFRQLLIPGVLVLLGFVMLLAGKGGGRLGGRILVVILGAIVLFFIFGFAVSRTI